MILDVARCFFMVIHVIYKYKNSVRPPLWEIAVHLAVAGDVCYGVFLCCPFSRRGALDEILNLIESVSEGFPSYSLGW